MMSNNTMSFLSLEGEYLSPLNTILIALTALGMTGNIASVIIKFILKFAMPDSWKLSCLLLDISHFSLGIGLSLLLCHIRFGSENLCKASGFFLTIGVLDTLCIYLVSNVIMLFVQYPEKLSGYSRYPKWTLPAMLVPEKSTTFLLALFPILPIRYFTGSGLPFPITCFPVRSAQVQEGSGYGAALILVSWFVLIIGVIICLVTTFRLWRSTSGGRIHASSPDIWQTMMLTQGKTYQKFLLLEQMVWIVVLFITTVIIYTNSSRLLVPQWIALMGLGVTTVFHAVLSNVVTVLWSTLCCRTKQQAKEPFHKLKKLELLKIDAPGKIRMKAMWSVGRGVYKRGLLKVYGVDHLKAWAQEIVILGMMRKSQSASLLQCLWTNSGNPYFETMTLITGEIIPKDSRLICFELTNSGTLDDFLYHLDVPLPETCQRTIIHDVAEGLSCLHSHNILHRKLTSACVYLKGSVQCMVLRAALGDFEAAQIYGTLQGGSSSSSQVSRKQFFLPDIRAFALVALEIISYVCKKRQEEKQPFRKTRSEIAVDRHRTGNRHNGKCRDSLTETFHKSRSLDERAISGDGDLSDVPCMGSLINVREAGAHPNVPEDDIEASWGQPMTSIMISGKSKSGDYSDDDSARTLHVEEWDTRPLSPRTPKDEYAHVKVVKSKQIAPFKSHQYENDYEEIEEIAEEIQRNQMAIQQIRYPQKTDLRVVERSWRNETLPGGHYSMPVDIEHPRFIDHTQIPALPKRNAPVATVFHRSDPLRHSATSSVSTLEDIQEELPDLGGESQQIAAALRDLWLMQDEDKKQKLLRSYNERMRKELKDVFTLKNKKQKKKESLKESVNERSPPASTRDTYQTPVVPFAEYRQADPYGDVDHVRPQTTHGAVRVKTASADKPVPHRRAPPPPRPATAAEASASRSRPQTAGSTVKKTQARAKLKRVIGQKQSPAIASAKLIKKDNRGQSAAAVEMKYATVKKIPQIKETPQEQTYQSPLRETVPEKTVVPNVALGKFSSFSSNDSLGSSFYKHSPRKADVSLTSGELTSLSSLAETTVPPVQYAPEVIEIPQKLNTTKEERIVNGKLVDSGFDSGSIASDTSCNVSEVDERTCSCPSGSYCSECCSSNTITPTSGMHTQAIYPRRNSWGNTDSFSSYDSTDLDQKLERLRNGDPVHPAAHVLGPDEQYPVQQVKEAVHHHKQHNGESPSMKRRGKVVSKTQHVRKKDFGQASKRYRELRKKGVPMRVSVVSSGSSQVSEATDWDSYMESTAEVIEEEEDVIDDNDDTIFKKLDSHQGFFEPDSDSSACVQPPPPPPPYHHKKPVAVVQGTSRDRHAENKSNAMILDEIIRELPEDLTGTSSMEDETCSFLRYPAQQANTESQEEEVVDMVVEMPYEHSSVVDAELIIDRLFTKRNNLKHKGSLQDVMDPILGFDENLIRELAGGTDRDPKGDLSMQMLKGVTESHVRSCRELSSKVPLVLFSELLPATNGQFRVLRSKLEKVGNFGSIGKELLDTVQLCWVNDSPPSAADLVSRLLDTVKETEL